MFEIVSYTKRFDSNKVTIVEQGGHPYIVRQSTNNGQKGRIDEDPAYLNPGNTISFGQDTATMFFQSVPYFTGDKIKILKPKFDRLNKLTAQFLLPAMRKAFSTFSWGGTKFDVQTLKAQSIKIPEKNGKVDFDFMEQFIAEAGLRRIAVLKSYMRAAGLKNYTLNEKEKQALVDYQTVKFEDFPLLSVFDINNTHCILSNEVIENSGATPYLCASTADNGVSSYVEYDKSFLEAGNCIFIGGKTFVVTYQAKNFYSNDSHNLALYLKNTNATRLNQLFLATCVKKSLAHKYEWGNSISYSKIQHDLVSLPAKNGLPDFDFMETYASAIQKTIAKTLALFAEREAKQIKKLSEH